MNSKLSIQVKYKIVSMCRIRKRISNHYTITLAQFETLKFCLNIFVTFSVIKFESNQKNKDILKSNYLEGGIIKQLNTGNIAAIKALSEKNGIKQKFNPKVQNDNLATIKQLLNEKFSNLEDIASVEQYFYTVIDAIFELIRTSLFEICLNDEANNKKIRYLFELAPKIEELKFTGITDLIQSIDLEIQASNFEHAKHLIEQANAELQEMVKVNQNTGIPIYPEYRMKHYRDCLASKETHIDDKSLLKEPIDLQQASKSSDMECRATSKLKLSSQPQIDDSAELTQENKNLRAEIAKIRAENKRLHIKNKQQQAAMTELRAEENGAVADASLPLVVSPLKHSTVGKRDLFLINYTPADIEAAAAEIAKTAGASTQSTTHSTDDFKQFLSPSLPYADRKNINAAMVKARKKLKMGVPAEAVKYNLETDLALDSNNYGTLNDLTSALKTFLSKHPEETLNDLTSALKRCLDKQQENADSSTKESQPLTGLRTALQTYIESHQENAVSAAAESKGSARVNPLQAEIKQIKKQGIRAMLAAQLAHRR